MSSELTARQVDVTERGPTSRLSEKVDCRKSLSEKGSKVHHRMAVGEGLSKKVHGRRFAREDPLEKGCEKRSTGEGLSVGEGIWEKVRQGRFVGKGSPENVCGREGS